MLDLENFKKHANSYLNIVHSIAREFKHTLNSFTVFTKTLSDI